MRKKMIRNISLFKLISASFLCFVLTLSFSSPAFSEDKSSEKKSDGLFSANFQKAPTYIKSKKMTLFSEDRKVQYEENVEVLHEDMKLTCDKLEALYTAENEIDKIFAFDNVFIQRENGTQARSEKAVYEKATEIVTLTINPEVQENGSVVTADTIRIYLTEDRSEAEGNVRVKLVQQKKLEDPNQPGQPGKQRNNSGLGSVIK